MYRSPVGARTRRPRSPITRSAEIHGACIQSIRVMGMATADQLIAAINITKRSATGAAYSTVLRAPTATRTNPDPGLAPDVVPNANSCTRS